MKLYDLSKESNMVLEGRLVPHRYCNNLSYGGPLMYGSDCSIESIRVRWLGLGKLL